MDKILHVDFIKFEDEDGEYRHRVESPDDNRIFYNVYNLCECPEDATVYRDLFGGGDYLDAIQLGMELAREGYTSIEVSNILKKD